MPRFDSEGDVLARVTGVEWGPIPQMSNTPKYLVIRGVSSVGPRELLIGEGAARVLQEKLKQLLPVLDSE
jgi:hypothetical protein